MTAPLDAAYFDGRSSARRAVKLHLEPPGALRLTGEGVERIELLSQVEITEPMGTAPRRLVFADGAVCEVAPQPGLDAFLAGAGHAESAVVRIQARWRWAIVSALALVLLVLGGYRYGLPWAAAQIAERLPQPLVASLSNQSLRALEQLLFEPTALPVERREAIAQAFARMRPPDEGHVAHEVLFRSAPAMGANALALPSGIIVVTDELVELAGSDAEILAVLTHELGHVHERHGLRLMVESSIVGIVLAWYLGDVSSIAAGVPAALLQARYSREHERAADDYAARMLQVNGMAPALLADMLEKLDASHRGSSAKDGESGYLSSHPATRERIQALRGAR
jgi:Zn-dependent protease with chaperone function